MYVIVKDPVAWIDVEWTSLDVGGPKEGEASAEVKRSFRMKVKFLPRAEFLDMMPVEIGGNGLVQKDIGELAREVCLDWDGPVDEDKRPVPFSIETLSQIIEHERGFAAGFELSYLMASNGRGKVREKNSKPSPAAGPAAGGNRTTRRARRPASKSS